MERDFESEVLMRLTRIETKMDDYDFLKTRLEETRAKSNANESKLNDIDDKLKWITRTAVGSIITGGISIIILFIKVGMGL